MLPMELLAPMEQTAWNAIALAVMALPKHGKLHVPRETVPHPAHCGFYRSVGLNVKARHYRFALRDGRGVHVHEHDDHYHVHWDAVDPSVSLLRHFLEDVVYAITRPFRGEPAPDRPAPAAA